MGKILDAKVKVLIDKSNTFNLVKNSDLNTKLATLATKAYLKWEQDKIVKLQAFDLSYFCSKHFLATMTLNICFFIKQRLVRWS